MNHVPFSSPDVDYFSGNRGRIPRLAICALSTGIILPPTAYWIGDVFETWRFGLISDCSVFFLPIAITVLCGAPVLSSSDKSREARIGRVLAVVGILVSFGWEGLFMLYAVAHL
ncbi:MAG TPA: hypothetical protein VM008_17565 [Phycisphaerae bacterium]|nr:hypothetical protein [Phycisphaerae bacterium]